MTRQAVKQNDTTQQPTKKHAQKRQSLRILTAADLQNVVGGAGNNPIPGA